MGFSKCDGCGVHTDTKACRSRLKGQLVADRRCGWTWSSNTMDWCKACRKRRRGLFKLA